MQLDTYCLDTKKQKYVEKSNRMLICDGRTTISPLIQKRTICITRIVTVEIVNVLIDCVGVDPTIYVQGRGT
jgi:hypothetical protein